MLCDNINVMKIEDVKLVVCDIDGTLVNDEHEFTPLSKKAVLALHEKGIGFGVASGRDVGELRHFATRFGLGFPFDIVIGMNGAQLYDEGHQKRFEYYMMKKEWIKEVLDIMRPFDLNPYIIIDDRLYCKRHDELITASSKRNGTKIVVVKDESEYYQSEHPKIMFKVEEDKIDAIMAYAKSKITGGYMAFKTQPIMLEFADKRTDKGYALKEYARMNDLDLKNVMAFGDMSNDNGMLRVSGYGVCLKNGASDTKQAADFITDYDNNHDGFARFLIKHKIVEI